MWEEAVMQRLLDWPDVADQVGRRIYWQLAPQKAARPHIVLTVIDDSRPRTMDGPDGFRESLLQVDVYAEGQQGYATAKEIREAVIACFDEGGFYDGVRFDPAQVNALDGSAEAGTDSMIIRREQIDLLIWHD